MPQFRDPNEKRDFMLNTPIPRLVPKMALPSIAGMLVTSAYNLADTLFVSQLGTDATGAVGVNGSIDLIIMMAGSLLAVGAASLTSRLLGAKQDERAREVLSTCFILSMDTKCLCRPDCAGLCDRCGANLNLGPCRCQKPRDPRMAVLEQLLDNKTDEEEEAAHNSD